jgi:hypothetical protein
MRSVSFLAYKRNVRPVMVGRMSPTVFVIVRHATLDECLHFSWRAGRLSLRLGDLRAIGLIFQRAYDRPVEPEYRLALWRSRSTDSGSAESGLWLAGQRDLDRHRKFDQQFATGTYSPRGLPALHLPEPP